MSGVSQVSVRPGPSQPRGGLPVALISLAHLADIGALVLDLLHVALGEAVADELPLALDRRLHDRRERLDGAAVDREHGGNSNSSNTFSMRQKPTRLPYSCQHQLGMSGEGAPPAGGVITVRGIVCSGPIPRR